MSVKHAFVSVIPNGGDATVVRPGDWNANHVVEPATITNAMLAEIIVRSLAADAPANLTTTGVEGLVAGAYCFRYFIRGRSAATSTGFRFGVNFTAATTFIVAQLRQVGTGTSAVTGIGDGVGTAAQIVEGYSTRALSTTAPNLGPTLGVDTANADVLFIIEGLIAVTATGDLELWHASEVAASSTVMAGSSLVLVKTG